MNDGAGLALDFAVFLDHQGGHFELSCRQSDCGASRRAVQDLRKAFRQESRTVLGQIEDAFAGVKLRRDGTILKLRGHGALMRFDSFESGGCFEPLVVGIAFLREGGRRLLGLPLNFVAEARTVAWGVQQHIVVHLELGVEVRPFPWRLKIFEQSLRLNCFEGRY